MAMNAVQFQPGLSLPEFIRLYGSESKCRGALFRTRWPNGFCCPRCEGQAHSRFERGDQTYYQCSACRHQVSLVSGTLFAATKLPLTTWFLALYFLTSTKTNMAALELTRHLGVSYRTAWRLKHKVMQAMATREESRQLSGGVQIDDAYLGGERNGGKGGRGSENKQAFLAAVEVGQDLEHPRHVVFEPVRHFDNTAILDWSARRLAPNSTVYSDGLWAFRRFRDAGHVHHAQATSGSRAALDDPQARWVNIVLSNLKRSLDGTYHAIKQGKYARRYLAEAAYRFNRRFDLPRLLPRLLIATLACRPYAEPLLRQASNYLS